MKKRNLISLIFIFIFFDIFALYFFMGGFKTVVVNQETFKSTRIIISSYVGPYRGLGDAWANFKTQWEKAGLKQCDALAIYLDPPKTPDSQNRILLGCKIDHLPVAQTKHLKEQFKHIRLPEVSALLSSFPFKNVLSYFIAPRKVYPAFKQQLKQKKTKPTLAIEAYGIFNGSDRIDFFMPLEFPQRSLEKLNAFFE